MAKRKPLHYFTIVKNKAGRIVMRQSKGSPRTEDGDAILETVSDESLRKLLLRARALRNKIESEQQ